MHTETIPSEQWTIFLDEFSRNHAGWSATIEMMDGRTGVQKAAEGLELHGISFDTKGTRPSSIQISLGGGTAPHVDHIVDLPFHIRAAEDHQGNVHLQIEPADGPPTLLHLRAPMH
jgi:hypothetical protein